MSNLEQVQGIKKQLPVRASHEKTASLYADVQKNFPWCDTPYQDIQVKRS